MPGPPPPPPPPVPAASRTGVVTGLGCPSCGGSLAVEEGRTNLVCRYCDTPLLVLGERGVPRLAVLPEIGRERAEAAVREWFGSGLRKARGLRRDARIEEAFLAFFPFVRVRFDVVGWVLGTVRRTVEQDGRRRTVEEPREIPVRRAVDRTAPAAEMAEFGVRRVNLAGDRLVPYDEEALARRGMVFRLQRAPEEIERAVTEGAREEARRWARLDRVTFSWLATVRRRTSVVHYPLWVFRYGYRGRTYQALVDAEDGTLAYGKAPGDDLYRAGVLVATVAGVAFVGTTLLQHLGRFLEGTGGLGFLGAVGLALWFTLRWGYRTFRHGGVVEEGTGLDESAEDSLGRAIAMALERGGLR